MELFFNIRQIRKIQGLNQTDFAAILGVSNTVLSNWELERAKPDIEMVQKISKLFGISIDNLLNYKIDTEILSNLEDKTNIPFIMEEKSNIPLAHPTKNGKEGIPLLSISAMAGYFKGDAQVLEHECERFIIPTFKDAEFLINIKGGSMYPKYSSGDIVACKKLSRDTFFQWNKVYVLDTEQGPLIKRIQEGTSIDTLLIISDNPDYKPFELNKEQIRGIAIVIGVIRLE